MVRYSTKGLYFDWIYRNILFIIFPSTSTLSLLPSYSRLITRRYQDLLVSFNNDKHTRWVLEWIWLNFKEATFAWQHHIRCRATGHSIDLNPLFVNNHLKIFCHCKNELWFYFYDMDKKQLSLRSFSTNSLNSQQFWRLFFFLKIQFNEFV